nr:GDP-fucose protein O-fucosyltransferase [Tanacetum cinerariifolium]
SAILLQLQDYLTQLSSLWMETYHVVAATWQPCADQRVWKPGEGNNGSVWRDTRLLNATLVLPSFMFSSVWRDTSQFADIYQDDYFVDYLKPDIRIVKALPKELQSLDLEAIGSVVRVYLTVK